MHSDNSEWTSKAKTILEETGAEDRLYRRVKGDIQNTDKPMLRASGV